MCGLCISHTVAAFCVGLRTLDMSNSQSCICVGSITRYWMYQFVTEIKWGLCLSSKQALCNFIKGLKLFLFFPPIQAWCSGLIF
jgi:hypothetical protein